MARLWQAGPHLQSTTGDVEFTTVSGTVSMQSTVSRLGPNAIRTNPTAGTAFVRQLLYAADSSTNVFFRTYVRFATFPGADATICRIVNLANNPGAQLKFIASTSKITLLDSAGTTIGSASATLSLNTWYRLELNLDGSTSPGSLAAKLDGTTFASGASPAQFAWQRVLWGTVTSVTMDAYWCDIAVNDSSGSTQNTWPGSGAVIALVPDAAGDANGWSNTANAAGGTGNYALANQVPPDDAINMVQTGAVNTEDMYNMSASGIGAGDTVNVVMIGARYRNNVADTLAAMKLQAKKASGGTIVQSAALAPNDTSWQSLTPIQPRIYPIVMYLDPDGSVPWTQATLDTMQAGVKLTTANVNRVQVTSVWASVDYTPSSSTPISGTETGTGTDATALATALAAAETGSGTDATSLSTSRTTPETATGVDATSLTTAITATDTGSGTDAATLAAAIPGSETAAGLDATSLAAAQSGSDTGTGTEASALALAAADTATGVDATTLTTALSSPETGTSADAATLAAGLTASDTGAGTEQLANRTLGAGETGLGADTATPAATVSAADTGTGTDGASVAADTTEISASDSASGADATSLAVTVAGSDTGSSADGLGGRTLSSAETATGVDATALAASTTTGETGSGLDVSATAVALAAAETAAGVDATALTVALAAGDTGASADAGTTTASLLATDTGAGVDALGGRTLGAADTGLAGDDAVVDDGSGSNQDISAADTGSTSDLGVLAAGIAPDQGASSAESTTITAALSAAETGPGSDTAAVAAQVTAADTGSAVDSASVTVLISAADSVTSADDTTLTAAIAALEVVAAAEAIVQSAAIAAAETGAVLDLATSFDGIFDITIRVGPPVTAWTAGPPVTGWSAGPPTV